MREEHLHIEVWDYCRLWFNSYIGYESTELIDIASGSTRRTFQIQDKICRGVTQGKLMCTLNLKIVLEEVWDFQL